jgi:transcriptional regulator with XRE-family HTH domain
MISMTGNSPLSVATHFARQMQKERRLHGWSLRELSARTGIAAGHLSRIENGHRSPTAAIAQALDQVFPERNGWFSDWHRESLAWSEVPAGFRSWAEFEETTRHLHSWTPGIIDGLLQVEPYATALMATVPGVSDEQVRDRVAGRMERQRRVLGRDDPPATRFVVDEVSLHRLIGSPQTMAAQMRHMGEVAALPNVTLQVLPLIAHAANASGLVVTDTAAYCEHMAGGYAYTDPVIVSSLAARFDALRDECYRASESRTMLERMHEQWETGASPRIPTQPAGSA